MLTVTLLVLHVWLDHITFLQEHVLWCFNPYIMEEINSVSIFSLSMNLLSLVLTAKAYSVKKCLMIYFQELV